MSSTNIRGPFLIIAPLSLVDQWQSEIATWSPDMNCILLHGNVNAREIIVSNEFYYSEPFVTKTDASALKKANVVKFHILLTTYEVAVKEIRNLCRVPWSVMVIDEAHKLKNTSSKLSSTLGTIDATHRILLTGTPLQNRTEELWSLLNFADPKRFADMRDFMIKFGDLKSASQVANLHEVLKPYLLRRIKEDVEKSLPPKEETIVEVALTSVQKRFYRAIFEKNTVYLYKGLKASNQPSLMNVMMELRKCCNHPYLVRGVEERVMAELAPEERLDPEIHRKKLIDCSGKLVLLDKLLPRLQAEGHKVLIFSQMVRVLNLLEEFLRFKGYSFERLDGGSKSSDRKEAVERFCKHSLNRFIMLLSTKAGGLGLNLTAADTVIIFDSDWNPQNDLQAQARAHRIGQTKSVMVYRLLTRKTYEMEMFHQASMKLGLDRAVLAHARNEQEDESYGSKSANNSSSTGKNDPSKLNAKEIDELLKRGAYDIFREDDTDQNEFVEADIDAIMQRRTHKVVYNEGLSSVTSTLGNFSKASFVSADEKEDVDINDPDFWKKAIGLKEDNAGELAEHDEDEILPLQRIRKQTKSYGDQLQLDEAQLKILLKPIKGPIKGSAADKAKLAEKQAQKEASAEERRVREEAKKAKAIEELKMKADPKNWGSHGRDRVLRCLNMYGFGRWERIKVETGKAMMETNDLESFCRAYVLQCGLCASEMEPQKSDTTYLLEAIQAAKEIEKLMKKSANENEENNDSSGAAGGFEIPQSLKDEKFVAKLKQQTLAKKALNKLDTLSKLINMIRNAVEAALKAKGQLYDAATDVDALFNELEVSEIAAQIPLGDVRPNWARTCSWWTLECDKHLLIGIFKHGFGRYDMVRDDETLLFKNKLKELAETYALAAAKEEGNENGVHNSESQDEAGKLSQHSKNGEEPMDVDLSVHNDNFSSPPSNKPTLPFSDSKLNLENAGDEIKDEDDMGEDKMMGLDEDDDEMGGGMKSSSGATNGIGLPDPRHLNRLITWLVSNEMARMSSADLAEKKRERKPRNSEKNKGADKTSGGTSYRPSDSDVNTADRELSLFSTLREYFDLETISLVYKQQIQGLKKCEQFLALQVPEISSPPPVTPSNHQKEKQTGADSSSAPRDELQSPVTSDEIGQTISPITPAVQSSADASSSNSITEFESIRLCATLILHGAPLQGDIVTSSIIQKYSPHLGVSLTDLPFSSSSLLSKVFCWSDLIKISGLKLSESDCVRFYHSIWLPFCEQIIRTKVLSYAQNKFVVPNPLLSTSDHHVAAKGLCQIFAIRQQLLYATFFVLSNCEEILLELLRSPQGRNVDNMPVWWCPWIHDLGLLIGFLKYGFLSVEEIFQDPILPFNKEYLEPFIRKVFFTGPSGTGDGVASSDITNPDEIEKFVKFSLSQYPDNKDLEFRIIKILEEITRLLPDYHSCKIIISWWKCRE
jgi:SNF2 family DNA or RNA helicase